MAGPIGSLDYLALRAPDVAALAAAYRDALDAAVIEEDYPERARLRVANVDVVVSRGAPADAPVAAFRTQDISALRDSLETAGFAVEPYEQLSGAVRMTFRDPAGNVLQALQWGARVESLDAA